MTSIRTIAISVLGVAVSTSLLCAQDLSKYREFNLGTSLPVVAKQLQVKPSVAKTIHQRPAVIQELDWQVPDRDPKQAGDSVRNLLFSFYNGGLFRILVAYDRERTEGLTAEDFIDALSVTYGVATRAGGEVNLNSTYLLNDGGKLITERSEKVIARWEDANYSYNLFQPFTLSGFGLVIYAKRLNALAQTAVAEATLLDTAEAPQKESERQTARDAADRAGVAKARRANKGPFRP